VEDKRGRNWSGNLNRKDYLRKGHWETEQQCSLGGVWKKREKTGKPHVTRSRKGGGIHHKGDLEADIVMVKGDRGPLGAPIVEGREESLRL